MIILCSDYVGFEILKYLLDSDEKITYLILDSSNKNNYNEKIIDCYKQFSTNGKFYFEKILDNDDFLLEISNQNFEFGILAWWPYILKGKILEITKQGWINFHPSLLPYNKGKNPNFWCLVDETKCGVSLQFIDNGIDTGDIIAQKEILQTWEDTGKTIYEKSRIAIIELFKEFYPRIKKGEITRIKQNSKTGTYHKSSELDQISEIKLDDEYKAKKLLNILRARIFPPYPTAFFYDDGKKYSIEIQIREIENE